MEVAFERTKQDDVNDLPTHEIQVNPQIRLGSIFPNSNHKTVKHDNSKSATTHWILHRSNQVTLQATKLVANLPETYPRCRDGLLGTLSGVYVCLRSLDTNHWIVNTRLIC